MKKITLLAAVIVAVSFASCKKNHSCVCTDTYTDGTTYSLTYEQGKQTKKKAQESCDATKAALLWDKCELK